MWLRWQANFLLRRRLSPKCWSRDNDATRPKSSPTVPQAAETARQDVWIIRDGAVEVRTGCGERDHRGAAEALARYIAAKYQPPGALPPSELYIDEVIATYLKEHAQRSVSREFLTHTATPILGWWSGKRLSQVNKTNCRKYVEWRTKQTNRRSKTLKFISEQTARHDLKTLRTAINWYHGEYPLPSVP